MLALADQILEWKEFPKGLRVMLVDQDLDVINDLKCKLDSCGYSVTCYTKGEEALQALEDKNRIFHVVVVDATRNDTFDGFTVAAAAKHLTTIMMASTENMNIMMQGISAGASEFLQKPLSEERLKNIWQHVVRKALVSGHLVPPSTLVNSLDSEFKDTSKPYLASNPPDGCHDATDVEQEDGVRRACNADQLDDPDEMCSAQELFFHDDSQRHILSNSSFMDMDVKDNCDAFLCSTPPQLEHSCTRIVLTDHDDNMELVGSPSMSASQELNMKTDLTEMHDYFDDCDNYLHIKSEVDEAVNNSVILNELFDSKSQINSENFMLMSGDHQSIGNEGLVDEKLCADLQLDDIPDSLDDITLGGDILEDTTDQSLSIGLDCLDNEDFQEADKEALLVTSVIKAKENVAGNPQSNVGPSNNSGCDNNNNHNMQQSSSTGSEACPDTGSRASEAQEETKSISDSEQSCNTKGIKSSTSKKKTKVDWTSELHRRFVQAVEQLGVDKAIPSRILELMGVKCLTRHNVASHLQKYRSHRKHVQAREAEAASWNQRCQMEAAADAAHGSRPLSRPQQPTWPPTTATSHPIQPRTAFSTPATPVLHVWGHPTLDPSLHFWPAWPPSVHCSPPSWMGRQMDPWGNSFLPAQPILRVPLTPMPGVANMAWPLSNCKPPSIHPQQEMVVAAINEVLRDPYMPLPLGLKSPSLESVVCELQRQGVSMASIVAS